MLSNRAKEVIDTLSNEELRQGINKGTKSMFQREKLAYCKTRKMFLKNTKNYPPPGKRTI